MKKILIFTLLALTLSGCALFKHKDKVTGPDEVIYSSLQWTYGGFNGSNCTLVDANMSRLNCTGNNMSYSWITDKNLVWKNLGSASLTTPDLICCLFVKNNSGKWVGGKFEWISVSRTTRAFGNINSHYGGWTLSDVSNPCECAFVIIHPTKKIRTNVIKGVWTR